MTAHNNEIGRVLGFPDQRDFNSAVGIERRGERIDGKKSVGLRKRRHRARPLAGRKGYESLVGGY